MAQQDHAGRLLELSFPVHEAQKPLDLFEFLIKLTTRAGQIVLDPFMGSGTTAVAAQSLDRYFIGFEISKVFWTLANERLNHESIVTEKHIKTKQSVLFK